MERIKLYHEITKIASPETHNRVPFKIGTYDKQRQI